MGTALARPRRLRVTVTPTRGWLHPLDRALRDEPGVRQEAFHGVRELGDGTVITLAELTGPGDRIERVAADADGVVSYTLSPLADGWLLFAWIEPTPVVERMLRLRRETDVVVEPPLEPAEGGSLELDVVGAEPRVRGAADRLQDGLRVSVDPVDESGLTPAHYAAVEAALRTGYYDSPRTASVEEVAASVDAQPEATERRLREAEASLFAHAVGE
ncbi:helix-turn-helix domain-containing protein [Halorarius halobius]|uniref:helix-turn-helix domain-containing protein n=1 Tax=Halorarius halobius TaxID=2962671 RepID=UPI0020CF2C34|nr:helix-turn-helix domain-containing protein [Halorarius halobius]